MNTTLSPIEVRILGCLIEKEATTPDVYPLTLNSLLLACNQKSSREPVMDLSPDDLLPALDNLIDMTLVSTWKSGHNRMTKYQHKLRHRVSDKYNFDLPELAVLCVLFLRGAQTAGEIRSRCARIHDFANLEAVGEVLKALAEHPDGPYVAILPRQEGRKEPRYAHLFFGEPEDHGAEVARSDQSSSGGTSRVAALELQVSDLKSQLENLEQRLESFMKQFE